MLNPHKRILFACLLTAVSRMQGFASPAESRLLPLIPREAQVVAGVEDPGNPDTRGHLLLVTVRNTFDFDDCLSLTGVDVHRGVAETVWVAASSSQGELNEHLLLVSGRFDRERIFHASEQNGLTTTSYRGLEVLLVKPFGREEKQMHDTRWMTILDGNVVVFGTPWLVEKALDRYVEHEPAGVQMAERLGRLRPQMNSWNVLIMPHKALSRSAAAGQSASWVDLFGKHLLDEADELTLGIRDGAKARVDFVIELADDRKTPDGEAEERARQLFETSSLEKLRPRIENLIFKRNRIEGSIVVPRNQLAACFKLVSGGMQATTLRANR